MTSINPAGYLGSNFALPSTLTNLLHKIILTSSPVRAYFKRFLRIRIKGRHSRSLCGPVLGRGASEKRYKKSSLSVGRAIQKLSKTAKKGHKTLMPRSKGPVWAKAIFLHQLFKVTQTPLSLSSIQCFGAAKRFKCFLLPRRPSNALNKHINETPVTRLPFLNIFKG